MGPDSNNEIVYVPIPQHLLPAFYRWLATMMTDTTEQETDMSTVSDSQKRNLNVIDLSIDAARSIGADRHPISLSDLHTAYLKANPGIGKGTTRNSFDATINFYTINMRSRFPNPRDKHMPASWLSRPVFKRVARGRYMLLSPDEIGLFRQCIEKDDPRIYMDEYDVDELRY